MELRQRLSRGRGLGWEVEIPALFFWARPYEFVGCLRIRAIRAAHTPEFSHDRLLDLMGKIFLWRFLVFAKKNLEGAKGKNLIEFALEK
jgi:hypothetical protein